MFRLLRLKPPHGWNAVAWELAIVTLGVLIALVAQQWVEERAWARKVDNAKSALAEELAEHYAFAVEWRTLEPCVAAQLDRLDQRLVRSASRNEPAPTYEQGGRVFVFRTPSRPYTDSVWQGIVADGVSSRISPKDRIEIGGHYRDVADIDVLNKQLVGANSRLNGLMRPMVLDPSTKLNLMQSIDETRDLNYWMGTFAGQIVDRIVKLKLAPTKQWTRDFLATSRTRQFCVSQGLPLRTFEEASKPIP